MSGDWRNNGNCRSYASVSDADEPWPWDTTNIRGKDAQQIVARRTAVAKSFCHGCLVRQECLDYAIGHDHADKFVEGIWGGMLPEERAAIQGLGIKFVSGSRRYAEAEAA